MSSPQASRSKPEPRLTGLTTALLSDNGAAASGEDFFRSAAFLAAEGATHTLIVGDGTSRVCIPLVVRMVPGTSYSDAISPYGFPGGRREGPILAADVVDLAAVGLVSAFVRERLIEPALSGGTARSVVVVHDPSRPRSMSKTFRRDIRRAVDAAYRVELHRGMDVDDASLRGFAAAYHDTMGHVGAAQRYWFDDDYLRACLEVAGSWLTLVRADDGEVAAGELVVSSDGLLHSYLAGTRNVHRPHSPGKVATLRAIDLADELGLVLNFGGGLRPGDGIERSKRAYGNDTATFTSHELVGDPAVVRELSGNQTGLPGFFPPYRAPELVAETP